MRLRAGEVRAGEAALRRRRARRACPSKTHLAAEVPGAGAEVDDVIGGADRLLVVLDDEHGVAEIAQAAERRDEALVVALVQADARLVEHVHHAGELAAELAREPDALRLAAGERRAGAVERQVVEPDVEQEAEARVDLAQRALGDRSCVAGESASASNRCVGARGTVIDVTSAMPSCRDRAPRGSPGAGACRSHASHGRSRMNLPVVLAHLLGARLAVAAHRGSG